MDSTSPRPRHRLTFLASALLAAVATALVAQEPAPEPEPDPAAASLEQTIDAIEAMRAAVATLSPDEDPLLWAAAQNRLGSTLLQVADRFDGDQRRNLLEQAEDAFRAALTRLDEKQRPAEWSNARFNLASTLLGRADLAEGPEAAKLLRAAIAILEPLPAVVPSEFAMLSAAAASHLGDAHAGLAQIEGDPKELAAAAEHYRRALAALPAEARAQRGQVETQLAGVLSEQARGGAPEPSVAAREAALAAYERAAGLVDRGATPALWAALHKGWGDAALEQGMAQHEVPSALALQRADQSYHEALAYFTREQAPDLWLQIQINRGAAALRRSQEDPVEAEAHLKLAGECFGQAATLLDRERDPMAWARLQHNLGQTFRLLGRRQEAPAQATTLLTTALGHLRAALEVLTRDQHPQAWAETQTSLGAALQDLARRKEPADAAALIDEASAALRAAREVLAKEEG
jgi:hypothetical protein